MTGRERFLRIACGEVLDELFLPFNFNYSWFMEETVERWQGEGLPEGANLRELFGFDRVEFTGGKPYSPVPPFEEQVVAEDEETVILRDENGVTKKVFKRHTDSKMPQWLDFPIKSRADFRAFARRLDPRTAGRIPADLAERAKRWAGRDYPLGIGPGSFYGHTLQRWVGTEQLCLLFYEDPAFVHEMLEYLEEFFLGLLEQFLPHVRPSTSPSTRSGSRATSRDSGRAEPVEARFDFASFGEDIAYKGRSFLSPATFREFIQPRYRRLCEELRGSGVDVIFVDSDGYIGELIPLWLEVGIHGFSPLEIAAGMDPLALKKRFGKDIVLAGGIDKRALIRGGSHIDREVEKAKALLHEGGYFPAVDHSVPPDVPLAHFRYFLDRLRAR